MLVNPWEAMRSKEVMLKIKTQYKIYGCNICGISFMYEGQFVLNIHIYCTICHIQFHDLKSLNHFFFKHKSELFKCEVYEKYFKAEDYLASHGTRTYNKCHLCGKMFKIISSQGVRPQNNISLKTIQNCTFSIIRSKVYTL